MHSSKYRFPVWLLVSIWMLLGLSGPALAQGLPVAVDGEQVVFDVEPALTEGRVLVPLRAVFEKLGARVDWNNELQKAEISRDSTRIELKPGESKARINGTEYNLDVPAAVLSGRILVPLRFVSEALGAQVSWLGPDGGVAIFAGQDNDFGNPIWGFYVDSQSYVSLTNNLNRVETVLFNSYRLTEQGEIEETVFFPQGLDLAETNNLDRLAVVFQDDRQLLNNFLNDEVACGEAIRAIHDLLADRGYEGVNLDLEMVAPEDRERLTGFIQSLAEELKQEGYILSLSLPAKTSEGISWYSGYDYAALGGIVDQVVLMAYDQHYSGGAPGPLAGLDWVEQVVSYAVQEIPADKILLGIGLYGYDWPRDAKGKAVDLDQAEKIRQAFTGQEFFESKAYSPGYIYQDASGVTHSLWYEDAVSIRGKLEVVKKYGLKGAALWRLGIVPPEIWEIIS